MAHTSTRKGQTGRAARAGLAALLLASGVGAAQGIVGHTVAHALAGSPKPDWRGADLGNSGAEAVNGPATTPAPVFNVNPGQGGGVIQGIELDGAGNVLFTKNDGFVYSYTPAGTQNWVVNTGSSFGSDVNGAASNPVASADGNVYVATDQGNLLRINAATGASTQFVNYGAPVQQTLKVDDATNNVFFGGQDHFINSYSKATTPGTSNYSTAATGSTQDGTLTPSCNGAVSGGNTALFYGEGALDSSDNFYVGDLETKSTGPRACSITTFGTLYKVSATGAIVAKAPLAGPEVGAVTLISNTAVAGGSELVVATKQGFVEAFDASLNRLWATRVANASVNASPAVDVARNRVYAADNASALHALNLTTGAIDTTFNGGATGLTGGTNSSPIIDAGGNVYVVDSTGTLFKFSPSGATVYSLNTGIGTGFFSPAIATDGTIYVGGNVGQASGFNAVAVNTATNTAVANTATNTPVPATATNTSTNTAVPATNTPVPATATNTAVPPTNTATNTAVPPTSTSTNTAVPPTNTATNTPKPTNTNTAVPATATNTAVPNTATNTSVPATATNTPKPTNTNTAVPATSTNTAVPATATNTATNTAAPATATNTATNTPVPATSTNTARPTSTNTPVSATSTNTAVPATSTNTAKPTNTNTAVPATSTNTAKPTNTNTPVPATATNTPKLTNTNTAVPATATNTSTNTPVPATSTNTPKPTSTNTAVPATSTNTPKPTNTNTAVPATSTNTAKPTSTNTAVPATATATNTATNTAKPTNTNTAVPATSTNTPKPTNTSTATSTSTPKPTNTPQPTSTPTNTPQCGKFYDVPIYRKVKQGDAQGIGFQAPIGSQVETEIVTTSTYPMKAILVVPTDDNGDVMYTTLTGQHVHNDGDTSGTLNAYKYSFNVGPYKGNGYALLVFQVPNNAPIETVLVPAEDHEPSGCEQEFDGSKTPTFQVVPGNQQDEDYSGGNQGDREMSQDSDSQGAGQGAQAHVRTSATHPFFALSRASHTVTLRHGASAANIHLVHTTGKVRMQFSVHAHGHQRGLTVTFR